MCVSKKFYNASNFIINKICLCLIINNTYNMEKILKKIIFLLFLFLVYRVALCEVEIEKIEPTYFFQSKDSKIYEVVLAKIKNKSQNIRQLCFVSPHIYKGEKCINDVKERTEIKLLIEYKKEKVFEEEVNLTEDNKTKKIKFSFNRATPVYVYFLNHFHYDPVWKHPEGSKGYLILAHKLIKEYLATAQRNKQMTFVLEQIPYLKPYIDLYPEDRELLNNLIKENRLEITGGSYNQPDNANPSGEELLRNILYGKEYIETFFPLKAKSSWQLDVFGHSLQFLQILNQLGINSISFLRGGSMSPPFDFMWQAPDGSKIIGYDLGVIDWFPKQIEKEFSSISLDKINFTNEEIQKLLFSVLPPLSKSFSTPLIFIPAGDDFVSPMEHYVQMTSTFIKQYNFPKLIWATPQTYFNLLKKEYEKINYRLTGLEAHNVFPGCYTSRIELKKAHRLLSQNYIEAEKWATIASMFDYEYPYYELDYSLRTLLYNQHHDSIPGTSEGVAIPDTWGIYYKGWKFIQNIIDESLNFIAKKVKGNGKKIVVFNSLSWERDGLVEVKVDKSNYIVYENKKIIPSEIEVEEKQYILKFIAKKVPSLGYKTYKIIQESKKNIGKLKEVKGNTIENKFYRLSIDEKGSLKEIYHKNLNKNILKDIGNKIISYEDLGSYWDFRYSGKSWEDEGKKITKVVSPLSEKFIIKSNIEGLEITKEVTLYNDLDLIFFSIYFPKTVPNRTYKVEFPINFPQESIAYFDDRFYVIKRVKNLEFPGLTWVDLSDGTKLLYKNKIIPLTTIGIILNRQEKYYKEISELISFLAKYSITAGMYDFKTDDKRIGLWLEIDGEGIKLINENTLKIGIDVLTDFLAKLIIAVKENNDLILPSLEIKTTRSKFQSVALLNKGGVGYEIRNNTITYTLLRSSY